MSQNNPQTFIVKSEKEYGNVVNSILQIGIQAKVIGFRGELGAGKTTLIKEICLKLGVKDEISSPTFSIVQEYDCPEGRIYHMDWYRVEDERELVEVGISHYFDSGRWIFVEWADKFEGMLPRDSIQVAIEIKNEMREVTIQNI